MEDLQKSSTNIVRVEASVNNQIKIDEPEIKKEEPAEVKQEEHVDFKKEEPADIKKEEHVEAKKEEPTEIKKEEHVEVKKEEVLPEDEIKEQQGEIKEEQKVEELLIKSDLANVNVNNVQQNEEKNDKIFIQENIIEDEEKIKKELNHIIKKEKEVIEKQRKKLILTNLLKDHMKKF